MEHNGYTLSQIIAGLEWYARVASEIGHCVIPAHEINAYLKTVKKLTKENENLHASCTVLTQNLHACKADTVRKMQNEIETRCIKGGIYPAFVKSTIDKVAEEMIEGDPNG